MTLIFLCCWDLFLLLKIFVSWGSGSKKHLLKKAEKNAIKYNPRQYCWNLVNAENDVRSEHVNKAYMKELNKKMEKKWGGGEICSTQKRMSARAEVVVVGQN